MPPAPIAHDTALRHGNTSRDAAGAAEKGKPGSTSDTCEVITRDADLETLESRVADCICGAQPKSNYSRCLHSTWHVKHGTMCRNHRSERRVPIELIKACTNCVDLNGSDFKTLNDILSANFAHFAQSRNFAG
eukprot:5256837-Pleurochrysis_carterae.AAC.2